MNCKFINLIKKCRYKLRVSYYIKNYRVNSIGSYIFFLHKCCVEAIRHPTFDGSCDHWLRLHGLRIPHAKFRFIIDPVINKSHKVAIIF